MRYLWLLLLSASALAQHSVTLACNASTTPGVTGYNFYRGTVKGGESAVPLNAAPLLACNYADTSVVGLATYYYWAKAVCLTCSPSLSDPSNEVTAVIPGDPKPAAPTGLSVGTVANNQVPLFWTAPLQPSGYDTLAYELFRGTSPSLPAPARIAIVPARQTQFVDGGCGRTVCYYQVKAYVLAAQAEFALSGASNVAKATLP